MCKDDCAGDVVITETAASSGTITNGKNAEILIRTYWNEVQHNCIFMTKGFSCVEFYQGSIPFYKYHVVVDAGGEKIFLIVCDNAEDYVT